MEPKENFKQRLLGLQGNLFSFAFQLTSNKEEAEDLLQDTTLKALTNEEKFAEDTFKTKIQSPHTISMGYNITQTDIISNCFINISST